MGKKWVVWKLPNEMQHWLSASSEYFYQLKPKLSENLFKANEVELHKERELSKVMNETHYSQNDSYFPFTHFSSFFSIQTSKWQQSRMSWQPKSQCNPNQGVFPLKLHNAHS